jgi:hypothetical protein
LPDIEPAGARSTAQEIVAVGGTAASVVLDVTVEETWSATIADIVADFSAHAHSACFMMRSYSD